MCINTQDLRWAGNVLQEEYGWKAVGAQSQAGWLPAGRDQEGWQDDIQFPVNSLKWHMNLFKDYKQILRRQGSFVQVTLRFHWDKSCTWWIQFLGMSLLPFHQNYLTSQFAYIQGISIFVCLELGTKGSCYYCKRTIILTTIPNRVLLYLFLRMEKLRPRGLLLIWKERGKLRTHVWLSEGSLFNILFGC